MKIAQATRDAWNAGKEPAATPEQLAELRQLAGNELPADYEAFVAEYGFPYWPEGTPVSFEHVHDLGARRVALRDELLALVRPEKMKYTLDALRAELDILSPRIARAVPMAGNHDGHSMLILELAPQAGRVWHWSAENLWDDFDDPTLGFVANSFTAFIEGLDWPEGAADDMATPLREYGTRDLAPGGFVLPRETRTAWAENGSGNDPASAGEIAAVERAIGHALPEQYRRFLTTFGHVAWPFDGIKWFDLESDDATRPVALDGLYSVDILMRRAGRHGGCLPIGYTSPDGDVLIGLEQCDCGVIYWCQQASGPTFRVAADLETFLGGLYASGLDN